MSLPTLTGTGRLIADPELRIAPSGTAVCNVRIAFNSRKKNEAGEWIDGDTCYMNGTLFRDEAERVAESLPKGTEVFVTGRLKTRKYVDQQGQERSATDMVIDSIGPTLKYANVKVAKLQRSKPAGEPSTEDAWATAVGKVDEDEAPF